MQDEDLTGIERHLEANRPVPSAAFRGALRRHLLLGSGAVETAPRHLRLLIATYAGSGLTLLLVAAAGVSGAGPLAS